jgi:hypothetical protein
MGMFDDVYYEAQLPAGDPKTNANFRPIAFLLLE